MILVQGHLAVSSLIKCGIGVENIPRDVDFVIESITENLEIKLGLFEELDKTCPPHRVRDPNPCPRL